jgi:hypothetical protein
MGIIADTYQDVANYVGNTALGEWWTTAPTATEVETLSEEYFSRLAIYDNEYQLGNLDFNTYEQRNQTALLDYQAQLRTNGEIFIDSIELLTLFAEPLAVVAWSGRPLRFAQLDYNESFSTAGRAVYTAQTGGNFAIETIDDLASAIRQGAISANDIPISIVRVDGVDVIQNTRTYQALERAGIDPSDMKFVDNTDDPFLSGLVEQQLARNGLSTGGVNVGTMTAISTGRVFKPINECFGAGTPIDMWPLDPDLKPGLDGIYDQDEVRAKVWKKSIELIEVGDTVVSFDDNGNMVPGHVPRIFQNEVKILLNFFGTRVTPGHVYYRADSKKAHKFETLIDILRDDGVIQKQDGTLIRAATNVPVGGPRDGFVKASTGTRCSDGSLDEKDQGRVRLGTRFIIGEGEERKHWAIADLIERAGGVVGDDEMIRVGDGPPMAFHWEFGDTLPRPEDFVLKVSGTTLEDIYKAAEWESQQPQMPAPMVMDGGPIQPLPHTALKAMPRNEPLNLRPTPAAKPRQALNRKQRKAMEAKQRKAAKMKRVVG